MRSFCCHRNEIVARLEEDLEYETQLPLVGPITQIGVSWTLRLSMWRVSSINLNFVPESEYQVKVKWKCYYVLLTYRLILAFRFATRLAYFRQAGGLHSHDVITKFNSTPHLSDCYMIVWNWFTRKRSKPKTVIYIWVFEKVCQCKMCFVSHNLAGSMEQAELITSMVGSYSSPW